MNKNDSRRIMHLFDLSGFVEASEEEADFIIVNACSVRGRVVDKIRGKINNLPKEKTLILTGCVLDSDMKEMREKFDYILKIKNLHQWHKKIKQLKKITGGKDYFQIEAKREKPIEAHPSQAVCIQARSSY